MTRSEPPLRANVNRCLKDELRLLGGSIYDIGTIPGAARQVHYEAEASLAIGSSRGARI
jgi:hypothetical protein